MAIIYTYPEINEVEGEDLLLISDTSLYKRPTRSVTMDNLAAYVGTVIGIGFWNLGTAPDSIFTTKMASIGQNANIASSKLNVYKTDDMTASVPHIATFNESSSSHSLNLWPSPGDNAADIYGSVSRGTFTGSGTVDQIIGSNPISRHSGSGSVNFIQGVQATANLIGAGSVETIVASYAKTFIEGTGNNNIANAFGAWNSVELDGLNDVDNIYGTYSNVILKNGDVNDNAVGHFIDFDQVSANTNVNNAYYIHAINDTLTVSGEKFFIKDETGIPSQFSNKLVLNAYGSGTFTGTATQRLAVDTNGNVIEVPIGSGPVDGSGTANYAARWIDTDTLGIGALYDNGTSVGIGTTSPDYNLDIQSEEPAIRIKDISDNNSFLVGADNGGAYLGTFTFDSLRFLTDSSEKMRIKQNGNVGIGTNNPGALLDVNGTTYLRSVALDTISGYSGNNIAFTNAGNTTFNNSNVGIGTTNPSEKLEVSGSRSKFNGILVGENSTNIQFEGDGNLNVGNNDWLILNEGGQEVMRAGGSSKNVGIGTTSPSAKLEVNGTIDVNDSGDRVFVADGSDGTFSLGDLEGLSDEAQIVGDANTIKINNGGSTTLTSTFNNRIGIGTTSPSQKLHVSGNLRVTGAYYDSNNSPGTAGKVLSSTGAATSWIEPSSVITKLIPYFQIATPGGSDTYTQSNNIVDFDWSGGSGTYEYILPSATAIPYRKIRFVNNSTISASNKIHITAPGTETIDGGSFYEIRKPYNGCAVWSDGVQWIVIQAKG